MSSTSPRGYAYTFSSPPSSYRTPGGYPPSYAPSFADQSSNYYSYQASTSASSVPQLPALADLPPTGSYTSIYSPYSHDTLSSVIDATCNAPVATTGAQDHYVRPTSLPAMRASSGYAPEYAAPKTASASYDSTGSADPFYMSYAGRDVGRT